MQHTVHGFSEGWALVACLFKILKHAELRIDGTFDADWGSPKARGMLAVLLTRPGEWFSAAEMRDWMWSEDEPLPRNMAQTFYGYAAKIRDALRLMAEPARLEIRKGSYRVVADRDTIDFFIARGLIDRARDIGTGDVRRAQALVKTALELWSDTPLADLPGELAERWRRRAYERIRVPALDALCDSYLTEGRFRAVLDLLNDLPVREPEPLMLIMCRLKALHGLARHREMAECYHRERKRLRDDFDDGSADALKAFYDGLRIADTPHQILRSTVAAVAVPHQLPQPVEDFVGGDVLVAKIDAITCVDSPEPRPSVVLLHGAAGVGKTALAVRWAHRVKDSFPGGQLYVDLDGFSPNAGVEASALVERLLEGVGIDVDLIPTADRRARKLAAVMEGRGVLVLLDNVSTVDQIRPVLPLLRSCVTIVTSRIRLPQVGRYAFEVRSLCVEQAVELLAGRIGSRAVDDGAAVAELVSICAGLPLALDLVAQNIAARQGAGLGEFVRQLRTERLLDVGDHGGDSDNSLRSVFSWSYRVLRPDEQRAFRRLGLHPGADITVDAAVALLDEPRAQVRRKLDLLVDAHLLEQPGSLERYRFHDLLRAYAIECANSQESAAEREAAELRLIDFFLHTAKEMDSIIFSFRPGKHVETPVNGVLPLLFANDLAARQWCVAERSNLRAVLDLAAGRGLHRRVCQLVHVITDAWATHGYFDDARSALMTTIGSAQLEHDEDAEGAAYNDLGLLHLKQSDFLAARKYLHLAEIIGTKNGNVRWIATSLHLLARLDAAEGREEQALQGFRQVLDMVSDGDPEYRELEAGTRHRLGVLAMRVNRRSEAATYFHEALRLRSDNLAGKADTLTELAELHRTQGELGSAEEHLRVAVQLHQRTHDRAVAARTCEVLAMVWRDKGDLLSATRYARRSVDCYDRVGNTIGKAVALDLLASLRESSRAFAAAEEGWLQALQIFNDAGDLRAVAISDKLARYNAGGPVPQARGPADHTVRR